MQSIECRLCLLDYDQPQSDKTPQTRPPASSPILSFLNLSRRQPSVAVIYSFTPFLQHSHVPLALFTGPPAIRTQLLINYLGYVNTFENPSLDLWNYYRIRIRITDAPPIMMGWLRPPCGFIHP